MLENSLSNKDSFETYRESLFNFIADQARLSDFDYLRQQGFAISFYFSESGDFACIMPSVQLRMDHGLSGIYVKLNLHDELDKKLCVTGSSVDVDENIYKIHRHTLPSLKHRNWDLRDERIFYGDPVYSN